MANITLKGNNITTLGNLPALGEQAPEFTLVNVDLSRSSLSELKGSRVLLNIFPSIDTGICAASVRHFNEDAAALENTKVLCISRDLPFAHARFCGAEGIENVTSMSDISGAFGKAYNLEINSGPMAELHSRCVIVLDEEGKVIYSEQVPEIVQEPNYAAALASLN